MLLFEQTGEGFDEGFVGPLYRQADAGPGARCRVGRQMAEPRALRDDLVERGGVGVAAGDQPLGAADGLGPFERGDGVFDREHRGGVDRLALEHAFGELALGNQAEHLRQRPGGGVAFEPFDRARAQDQHAVRAFAAQHFLPGEGGDVDLGPVNVIREHRAGRVGEAEAFARVGDPVGIGHAHARGGAVPGEQNVVRPVDRVQIGQLAVIGAQHGGIDLELLDRVGHPAFAEAFPGERGDGLCTQHRPHRHFERAGVGTGDDADAVRFGELQQLAHQIDGILQPRLADLRAVRAPQRFGGEIGGGPARRLGARARGKIRACRQMRGTRRKVSHVVSPYREHARRWDRVARRPPYRNAASRQARSLDRGTMLRQGER
ncbi:hypothetical protein D9M73_121180 [compost metagenome]